MVPPTWENSHPKCWLAGPPILTFMSLCLFLVMFLISCTSLFFIFISCQNGLDVERSSKLWIWSLQQLVHQTRPEIYFGARQSPVSLHQGRWSWRRLSSSRSLLKVSARLSQMSVFSTTTVSNWDWVSDEGRDVSGDCVKECYYTFQSWLFLPSPGSENGNPSMAMAFLHRIHCNFTHVVQQVVVTKRTCTIQNPKLLYIGSCITLACTCQNKIGPL